MTRAYVTRAALLWAGTRALVAMVLVLSGHDPVRLGGMQASLLCLLAGTIGFVDVARRRERVLLGNLGVPLTLLSALMLGTAIAGELLVQLAVRLA